MTTIDAAALWPRPWDGLPSPGGRIRLAGSRIESIIPGEPRGDFLVLPGLVNAHDHGRGLSPLAFGAPDAPLEAWLWDLWRAPRTDPYLTALVAFGRMARSGVTTVVHNHLPQGPDLLGEAQEVARAARDVGIRLSFVVPIVDRNLAGYDGGAAVQAALPASDWQAIVEAQRMPPVADQIAAVSRIAAAIDDAHVVTQYGPPGPQWLSEAAFAEVGDAAAADGRRVHVHLLETEAQRAWMDHHHPDGADAFFARAGLLNERLTIAHGVRLRRSEKEAFRDAGVTLVLNTSSNLRLASGVADGTTIAALGLRVGIGLDGMAFDDDADMLREVRLASRLLGPRGDARPGLDRPGILRAAFSDGRVAHDGVASPGLQAGADADLVMLSLEAVAGDRLDDDMATIAELAFGRWRRETVREVYVGGRQIVADGRLVGIDLAAAEAELTAAARSARRAAPPPDWIAKARAARGAASR